MPAARAPASVVHAPARGYPQQPLGLPDLVRFWPGERRYELIEVKGPGDRLQDNQTRWLAYCVAHGMPVRVIDVEWAGEGVAHAEAAGLSA